MKVATKIPAKKFRCPEGKVKAEGKKASPPFCYRVKVGKKRIKESQSMINGRSMVIEFHSRVTGRQIGYISEDLEKPVVSDRKKARIFVEGRLDKALQPYGTPEIMDKKVQEFIQVAQDPESDPRKTVQFRQAAQKAWKILHREAKKQQ